ncbi:MAG: prolipoprotein diacylglyceryl transferase [Deltaproteobacteria bacterium]|nr:prolipoprotein diacylglyceryl transferase [Deltaproteobacteria bacterium]
MELAYFYHNLSPIIFEIGPLQVRWYGVLYMSGFVFAYFLFRKMIREGFFKYDEKKIDSLLTYILLGVVLGARFLYVIVYDNFFEHLSHPWTILAIWKGGLSFHGSVIGVCLVTWLVSKKEKFSFWHLSDVICICVPLGLGFGRIGNFMNGELFGRITDVPWAFVFKYGGTYPRHPSQLYESFLEGFFLFGIFWFLRKKFKKEGTISFLFLIFYGVARFIAEFFREPDVQMGYYFNYFSMGQILCFLMILSGLFLFILFPKRNFR